MLIIGLTIMRKKMKIFNHLDEEVFQTTQGIMRRGASRSRSNTPEERASGSNDAIRLLRRGASRSRSETPPDVNKKSKE